MALMRKEFETIVCAVEGEVVRVTFNRAKELTEVFKDIQGRKDIRVVVLTGEGKSFCAGADVNWMRKVKDYTFEENYKDSLKLAELLYIIYSLSKPVVGKINGAAIGGGVGFVAICDIAIASSRAFLLDSILSRGLIYQAQFW